MLSYYAFTHDLSVHNIIGSLTKQRVLSTLTSTNFQNPNPTANDFAYPHKGAISNTTTPNEKKHPTTCLLKLSAPPNQSHKRAIAWKISDIRGIDSNFCTHKILMKDDFKPAVQHQRRVNPKIHEVNKAEVIKLLDAGLIYPISDNPWVSPVHVVPKKGARNVFYCFLDAMFAAIETRFGGNAATKKT
ncbi:hypothetical protein Tco_0843576 [Tanacetum coccineum]|uniref:Reverse transcriptase domain-containing protein n=1 Tax=Tanacetum coccineum TaxID=301880 RepID=A0ABQ5B898_9ASTR